MLIQFKVLICRLSLQFREPANVDMFADWLDTLPYPIKIVIAGN